MIDEREALKRAIVLLKAAYELMEKQEESPFVLNILEQTTVWDGVECDGYCLKNEIKDWLEFDVGVEVDGDEEVDE